MTKLTISLFSLLAFSATLSAESVTDVEAKYANKNSVTAEKELKQSFNLGFSSTSGNTETLNVNGKYDASFILLGTTIKS